LGRVPKAFVAAQLLAEKNGNVTRQEKEENDDPDVKLIGAGHKTTTSTSKDGKKSSYEVIDLL